MTSFCQTVRGSAVKERAFKNVHELVMWVVSCSKNFMASLEEYSYYTI